MQPATINPSFKEVLRVVTGFVDDHKASLAQNMKGKVDVNSLSDHVVGTV